MQYRQVKMNLPKIAVSPEEKIVDSMTGSDFKEVIVTLARILHHQNNAGNQRPLKMVELVLKMEASHNILQSGVFMGQALPVSTSQSNEVSPANENNESPLQPESKNDHVGRDDHNHHNEDELDPPPVIISEEVQQVGSLTQMFSSR